MNVDNQVTIIEITADYLCLVVLGDKATIDELITDINETVPNDPTKYISAKINTPLETKCLKLSESLGKDIMLDDGIESAQCRTYAEGYHKDTYMLMCVEEECDEFKLGFPKFDFGDEEYPDIVVENWLKKKVKKMPSGIKKNMKPIAVVGPKSNILVVATKIKNKKKKQRDNDE